MIVPQNRLLFWVAALVLPFGALGVAVPGMGMVSFALIAGLVALAAFDGLQAWGVLQGISVTLPAVVRLTKDRPGTITLRLGNERQQPLPLRLGIAFPREIVPASDDVETMLPANTPFATVAWPCTGKRRGAYPLQACYLEARSPLGLWVRREPRPVQSEIRVYPNLLGDPQRLAALFLRRGNFGVHAQRQVGQGREFEKLRDYIAGDSVQDIHWKATAKRRRPVTKIFQLERTQEVYVIVDSSRLSARRLPQGDDPDHPATHLERFVTAALVLGLIAERQGDLFGVISFSDKVQSFVRARNGRAHYNACRDALYTLHPQLVTPDYRDLCAFLRLRLRRRALLFVLTNLDDPTLGESFTASAELIGHQHLVLVSMVRPPGAQPLFSDQSPATVDGVYQRLGGHVQWHNLRERQRILQRRGIGFRQLDHEEMVADLVTQYLNVKRRQLL